MTIFDIENSFSSDRGQPAFSRMVQTIRTRVIEFQIRRRLRKELSNLSNQILRDIGLIRDDVRVSCD